MEIDLNASGSNPGYFVRVYDMNHNVPTRGYGICQRRKKLNPEYQGLIGNELKKLKETGVDISIYPEYKIVAYVLDTNIKCFEINPELLDYLNVIVECTFFGDYEKKEETSSREDIDKLSEHHIHWDYLCPIVKASPDVNFILVHFSMRYSWDEIKTFFDDVKEKENISNITVWMN